MTDQPLGVTIALAMLSGLGLGSIAAQVVAAKASATTARVNRLHDQRRLAHLELLGALDSAWWSDEQQVLAELRQHTFDQYAALARHLRKMSVPVDLLSRPEVAHLARVAVNAVRQAAAPHGFVAPGPRPLPGGLRVGANDEERAAWLKDVKQVRDSYVAYHDAASAAVKAYRGAAAKELQG